MARRVRDLEGKCIQYLLVVISMVVLFVQPLVPKEIASTRRVILHHLMVLRP
jgi:hypothetical protein